MSKSLSNPDSYESRLYLPNGDVHVVPYIPSREDFRYMDMAIDEAQDALCEGNVAIGAVIVAGQGRDLKIYKDHSTELTAHDLTAHAEMNAYKACQPDLGTDLSSAAAYVTVDPCEMCGRIFTQGHIGKLVIAAKKEDVPEFLRPNPWDIDARLRTAGRTILTVFGVRSEEAKALMAPSNKFHKSAGER